MSLKHYLIIGTFFLFLALFIAVVKAETGKLILEDGEITLFIGDDRTKYNCNSTGVYSVPLPSNSDALKCGLEKGFITDKFNDCSNQLTTEKSKVCNENQELISELKTMTEVQRQKIRFYEVVLFGMVIGLFLVIAGGVSIFFIRE